ncbi:unnamed protein product [Sympodiomycopsis kandeliae]
MLKGIGIWPSGPQDQTTPKASLSSNKADERNPFDSFGSSSSGHRKSTSGGGLSVPGSRSSIQNDPSTPSGLLTPGGTISTQSAIPTTSVSTGVPDFTMKLPPQKPKSNVANSASTQASTSAISSTSSSASNNTTRDPASTRGHLTIKLIEARNLAVGYSNQAAPYAVVSFDKNEFIGREPIDPNTEDASGQAVPTSSTDGSSSRSRAKTLTPATLNISASSTTGISARNPVWKHSVTFDVTQERQPIYISVYDRSAEEEGFLGMRLITPRLFHKMSSDQWYPLSDRDDGDDQVQVRGEIRVQISYEKTSSRKLTPADFEYLRLIGRGTFGRVFQVRKKDTKRIYAMKVLSKREIAMKKEVTHTMGERKILEKSLDCPFLVGLKFSFQSEHELYFVTDYKSGGELFWHLQREGRFTEERARFYIAELVIALGHLHKYDIVYRDLKPENILLDATGHVALCDFGLSKPDLGAGQLTNTFCGTTEYLAPEVLLDESGYSKLVDFWSLGVLLFEMCCGWSPFYAEDTQQMYRNICFGKIKFPRGAIGDDGKQFVKGLLNRNPKHRLGANRDAQDLMEHAFFRDIDFEALANKQLTPPFKPLVESEESVANFDPEFTETDVKQAAVAGLPKGAVVEDGTLLSASAVDARNAQPQQSADGGAKIPMTKEEEDQLSSSIQDKFRGFSYSGTYDESVAGSLASSFGGRRSSAGSSSGGYGLGGASLGMSKVNANRTHDDDDDDEVMRSLHSPMSGVSITGTKQGDEDVQME